MTLHHPTRTTSSTVQPTRNIDFNIPGVPNSTVKRSHCVNVHNLIQKIENHPQRQALQSDLQQHRPFNPFSKESQDVIKAAENSIATLASSTARAGTSYEMIRQKTKSTSSPFLISSLSRTFTSGRADHTVTGTGRKKVLENTILQINSKRSAGNEDTRTFTIELFVTHGSEKPSYRRSDPRDGQIGERRPHPHCHRRRTQRVSWQLVDTSEFCGFRHDAHEASP